MQDSLSTPLSPSRARKPSVSAAPDSAVALHVRPAPASHASVERTSKMADDAAEDDSPDGGDDSGSAAAAPSERFAMHTAQHESRWASGFVTLIVGFVALALALGIGLRHHSGTTEAKHYGMIALLLTTAVNLAATLTLVLRSSARGFVYGIALAGPIVGLSMAIGMMSAGHYENGGIGLAMGTLHTAYSFAMRHRLQPCAEVLSCTSLPAMHRFPSAVIVTAFVAAVIQAVWLFVFLVLALAIFTTADAPVKYAAGPFLWLTLRWSSQTLRNVVRVVAAYAYAASYFLAAGNAAVPTTPTATALRLALGRSFGTVCYASLVVPLAGIGQFFLLLGHALGNAFTKCCYGLHSCSQRAKQLQLRLARRYHFHSLTHMAVYGAGYRASAASAWSVMSTSPAGATDGVDLWRADKIVGSVVVSGAATVGLLNGGIGLALASAWDGDNWNNWFLGGFVFGFGVTACALEGAAACVDAAFLCYAEEPALARQSDPLSHARLIDALRTLSPADGAAPASSSSAVHAALANPPTPPPIAIEIQNPPQPSGDLQLLPSQSQLPLQLQQQTPSSVAAASAAGALSRQSSYSRAREPLALPDSVHPLGGPSATV